LGAPQIHAEREEKSESTTEHIKKLQNQTAKKK
jgi:hypothetical protein